MSTPLLLSFARRTRLARTWSLVGLGFAFARSLLALEPAYLTTEYTVRPLGLDVEQPRLGWELQSTERNQRQAAYRVLVATSPERLRPGQADVWDSARVESADNFGVAVQGPLASGTRYFWTVQVWDAAGKPSAWAEPEWWQMGLLRPDEWRAEWISPKEDKVSPWLRREFDVPQPVVQATAYAYASGWYELSLNGRKVDDRVLTPVNSKYTKGLFYDAYDVTDLVQTGRNAVGLWLGAGYDAGYSKWGWRWLEPKAALLQIELRLADGTTRTVITDEQWKSAESPILANHIYDGETYDARREVPGWDQPGFDDSGWQSVVRREVKAGPLKASKMPPLKIRQILPAVSLTEVEPGVFVFDFGQNIAGWTRLRVSGAAGTTVVLRHAEAVYSDGRLDITTNRAAKATDTYILKGEGSETYMPRFTYHGFRYVEVTGFPGRPTLESVEALAIHSALEETGSFTSSDPLLNRIHQNFQWSLRNNFMGIPTDTAVRDERTPCLMDSLAVEEAAIYNFNVLQYYTKWLQDIGGDVSAPPNWSGDPVVLPYLLYWHYGDRRILEQHYGNLRKATDHFAAQAEAKQYWANGFGDWAPPQQPGDYETSFSEGEIVNTAFFYRCAWITAEVARMLGQAEDATKYAQLAQRIFDQFQARHFHPETHTYGSGRQVTSVLPLAFGLVPDHQRPAVASALHQRLVDQDNGHLDTGIFGTRYLFDMLIDHGFVDSAFTALTKKTYPSYGYQISLGATTTWEQWTYRGSMQSFNHAMFSGPDATLYSRLGGIQPAQPGYREILIRPVHPQGLVHVDASTRTVNGWVRSAWRAFEGYAHRVVIPPNTTAQVYVPASSVEAVRESGRPATEAEGVRFLRMEDGHAVFSIGSGNYVFTVPPSS